MTKGWMRLLRFHISATNWSRQQLFKRSKFAFNSQLTHMVFALLFESTGRFFFNNLHVWSLYSFYAAVLLREDSVPVCCDAFALIMFSLWKGGERLLVFFEQKWLLFQPRKCRKLQSLNFRGKLFSFLHLVYQNRCKVKISSILNFCQHHLKRVL